MVFFHHDSDGQERFTVAPGTIRLLFLLSSKSLLLDLDNFSGVVIALMRLETSINCRFCGDTIQLWFSLVIQECHIPDIHLRIFLLSFLPALHTGIGNNVLGPASA
jgi:hypothetical protein